MINLEKKNQTENNLASRFVIGADVEREILANAGIIQDDTAFVEKRLEPVACPRCKTRNSHDSQYCNVCSMVLNEKAAVQISDSLETAQVSSDYAALLMALRRDLGMKS
ncbi:MAG: hypothetical protein A4E37_01642 [Methanoregulaceae archaeon PtaB.Bin056]|nr:MAG: hypothetical protein A4E37_01642 [Methanoregulaceae archaeon PtaB.Bin056]